MGRVYDITPDKAKGELFGGGLTVEAQVLASRFAPLWQKVKWVTRVEFDADADEGTATVTNIARSEDGGVFRCPGGEQVAHATFRCVARVFRKQEADTPVVVGAAT